MSTTQQQYDDSDLRRRFDTVVVSTNGKHTKRLHVPNGEGGPLCQAALLTKDWRTKSVDVYPSGFRDWCQRCQATLRKRDEAESSRIPAWVIEGRGEVGNALVAEWG